MTDGRSGKRVVLALTVAISLVACRRSEGTVQEVAAPGHSTVSPVVGQIGCNRFDDRVVDPPSGSKATPGVAISTSPVEANRTGRKTPLFLRTDLASTLRVEPANGGRVWFDFRGELASATELRFAGCDAVRSRPDRPWGLLIGSIEVSRPMCVTVHVETVTAEATKTRSLPLAVGQPCR